MLVKDEAITKCIFFIQKLNNSNLSIIFNKVENHLKKI